MAGLTREEAVKLFSGHVTKGEMDDLIARLTADGSYVAQSRSRQAAGRRQSFVPRGKPRKRDKPMTCKNSHTLISHGTRKGRALTLPLTCGNILSSLPWLISQLPLRKCGHLASEPAAARHRDPLGTRSEITPGSRAGVLAACLSAAFGLALATAADARAWLADGGWDRLDDWLAAHHGDGEDG